MERAKRSKTFPRRNTSFFVGRVNPSLALIIFAHIFQLFYKIRIYHLPLRLDMEVTLNNYSRQCHKNVSLNNVEECAP